jgi:phage baseplate assembly protein W
MAIVLGQKLVKDTEKYNDYAIGITLPIKIGNTAFNQSFTTIEQTKSNIKNLLLTKKYERLMQPNLGSGMQELLFEMNDEDLAQKIEDTINSSMETWLPFVTIEDISIEQTNEFKDSNQVNVSLRFRIQNNVNLETLSFNIQA